MIDADRLAAQAEDALVRSEMARSRLRFAKASRDALVSRWNDAQENRRVQRLTDAPADVSGGGTDVASAQHVDRDTTAEAARAPAP